MRRLLTVISVIVLVDTTFYAVVAPLLPEFSHELDLSKAGAGVLLAAYAAGTLAGALPSGMLAARIGPKRTVLAGLALMAASSVGFALGASAAVLDTARFVQGIGGACSWAGGLAWLTVEAPAARRGEVIGAALGAAIGGSLLGPVVGAAATAVGSGPVFGGFAAVAAVLATIAAATPGGGRAELAGTSLRATLVAPRVRSGMWLVAVPGLGFGVINLLVPLRLHQLGATEAVVAFAFLLAAVAEGGVSPLVGRVSDRRGRAAPIRVGLAASALLALLLPAVASAALTVALLVLTTAGLGTFWAPAMAWLSDAAEAVGAQQGLAFGLVNLAWAGGMVVGAAGGGALAKATADVVPYAVVAAVCLATLGALVRRPAAVTSAR